MKWTQNETKQKEKNEKKTLINVIASKSGTNDIFGVLRQQNRNRLNELCVVVIFIHKNSLFFFIQLQ